VLLGHYELGAYAIMANHVHVAIAEGLPIAPAAIREGGDGAAGESDLGPHGRDVLASRVLRPLGKRSERMAPRAEDHRWSSAAEPERSAEINGGRSR
jgi:hypothetical protein